MKTIYTIGHSTHTIDRFVSLLQANGIEILVDVRLYPGSQRLPHFNKPALQTALNSVGIEYIHFKELGGRLDEAYKSYADYMQTELFQITIASLETIALTKPLAYMCAEADWRHCHRAKISEYMFEKGWHVMHILPVGELEPHPQELKQGGLF
jgi:uncharacterized protein (DUF488 family)